MLKIILRKNFESFPAHNFPKDPYRINITVPFSFSTFPPAN